MPFFRAGNTIIFHARHKYFDKLYLIIQVFYSIRGKIKPNVKATHYYVQRHVDSNHRDDTADAEELAEIAAEVVANNGIAIGAFSTPTMKRFCQRANKAISDGISSHTILKQLRRKQLLSEGISERNVKFFTDHSSAFPSLCRIAEMVGATPGSSE